MKYDVFAYLSIYGLEDLGFVGGGEAGTFIYEGNTSIGGKLPMNANGGGLSYTHTPECMACLRLRSPFGNYVTKRLIKLMVSGHLSAMQWEVCLCLLDLWYSLMSHQVIGRLRDLDYYLGKQTIDTYLF